MRAVLTGLTDVAVHCMTCDWRDQQSSEGEMRRLLARVQTHAKQGHRIHVWRETLFVYNESPEIASSPPNQEDS